MTVDKGSQPLLLGHKDDPHSGLEIKKGVVLYNLWGFATKRKETKLPNKIKWGGKYLSYANTFHLTIVSMIIFSINY